MDQFYPQFLRIWHLVMWIATAFFFAAGLIILIMHWIKSKSLSDLKAKYDFLSVNEVKNLNRAVGAIAIAVATYVNTVYADTVVESPVWWAVRFFISICFFTLVFYISFLLFKYSYPGKLHKKLRRIRYTPRVSPDGNQMKILSEEEEDVHLDPGMQAEEDVFSIDYDVWVDESTGFVKIEKYPGHLQALECNSCGFQTMKVVKEDIITHPTHETTGQLIKNYECLYCGAKRRKSFRIAKMVESDEYYRIPEHPKFKEDIKISHIKIEILSTDGITKTYEFENLFQAKDFLAGMENEKQHGHV